jgi:hypothetical protein
MYDDAKVPKEPIPEDPKPDKRKDEGPITPDGLPTPICDKCSGRPRGSVACQLKKLSGQCFEI